MTFTLLDCIIATNPVTMLDNQHIRSLLEKQYAEELSAREQETLDGFLKTEIGERILSAFMDEKDLDAFDDTSYMAPSISKEIFDKLQSSIKKGAAQGSRKEVKQFFLQNTYKIAASLAGLLILSGTVFFAYQRFQRVTYITHFGQKETIILPDLSTVTLNGNSSLTYQRSWASATIREVELRGEAFFNVVKNKQKPFIVHAGEVEIKVLGTSFNVKSYSDDAAVEATLVEGKITIQNTGGNKEGEIIMAPNQQATFSKASRQITLSQVKTDTYTSWKNGRLVFEEEPFGEIMKDLERRYGVHIEMADETAKACRFSATLDQESLKEVLDLFSSTTDLSYRMSGDEVMITGNLCTTKPLTP
jgi:transmembrane sensor